MTEHIYDLVGKSYNHIAGTDSLVSLAFYYI